MSANTMILPLDRHPEAFTKDFPMACIAANLHYISVNFGQPHHAIDLAYDVDVIVESVGTQANSNGCVERQFI